MRFDAKNKPQLNIAVMSAAAVLCMALFFIFAYAPRQAELKRLRQELGGIKDSLDNIEEIAGYKENLGRGILRLREEADMLESRFIKPNNIGELLQILSERARRAGIEVVFVQPAEFKVMRDKSGKILQLENLECNKISMEMSALGAYGALVDYMQMLGEKTSAQFSIRKFKIEKRERASHLNIRMTVDCFVLLPKK